MTLCQPDLVLLLLVFVGYAQSAVTTPGTTTAQQPLTQTQELKPQHQTTQQIAQQLQDENRFNEFDWKLCKAIDAVEAGNLVVSPISVKLVLAMLYEGASGNTAKQIAEALNLAPSNKSHRYLTAHKFSEILHSLQSSKDKYEIDVGTRIFVDKSVTPKTSFTKKLGQNYNASLEKVDFSKSAEAAATINSWAEAVTRGHIQNLISDADAMERTVMLLLNAIYFKGQWLYQFPLNETTKGLFRLDATNTVEVSLMNAVHTLRYMEANELEAQIVRLPYLGNKFSMYVCLPFTPTGLNKLIQKLNPFVLREHLPVMQEVTVNVILPKFRFDYTSSLGPMLQQVGVKDAFTEAAELSDIAESNNNLVVSNVIQKAGIEVNEQGSTAHVTTHAELVNKFGEHEIMFNASHPFLFFIEDEKTGTVVFLGKVVNPTSHGTTVLLSSPPQPQLPPPNVSDDDSVESKLVILNQVLWTKTKLFVNSSRKMLDFHKVTAKNLQVIARPNRFDEEHYCEVSITNNWLNNERFPTPHTLFNFSFHFSMLEFPRQGMANTQIEFNTTVSVMVQGAAPAAAKANNMSVILVLIAVLNGGTMTKSGESTNSVTPPDPKDSSINRFNNFDIELLQQHIGGFEPKNAVISPASIKSVLGMVWEGASGTTEQELSFVMRLPHGNKTSGRELLHYYQMAFQSSSGSTELKVANQIFMSKDLTADSGYQDNVLSHYFAGIKKVNFETPEPTTKTINDWVSTSTGGLIPSLVEPALLKPDALLLLANAVYFKGQWANKFDKGATGVSCFYRDTNYCQQSYMMRNFQTYKYAFIQSLEAQAIELPYDGNRYSMVVLLPLRRDGVFQLIRDLPHTPITSILDAMTNYEIVVSLPRFTIEYDKEMVPILQKLGVKKLFDDTAELGGIISRGRKARVSSIVHKAKIEVNEQGTTAAAATGVFVVPLMSSPAYPKFIADHPFLFFIRDNQTGAILFAGCLSTPDQVSQEDLLSSSVGYGSTKKPQPSNRYNQLGFRQQQQPPYQLPYNSDGIRFQS